MSDKAKAPKAGSLDKRVTFQKPGNAFDEYGQPVPGVFNDVATMWASIRPIGSNERLVASQMQSGQTHVVTVRYQDALAVADGSWRIVFKARHFGIVGLPRNIQEGGHTLVFDCTEKT